MGLIFYLSYFLRILFVLNFGFVGLANHRKEQLNINEARQEKRKTVSKILD